MSNLKRAWTNNKLVPDRAASKFLEYVNLHRGDAIQARDGFIFDGHSLKSLINLSSCLRCLNYQPENCCCGNSYSMPIDYQDRIQEKLSGIFEFIPHDQLDIMKVQERSLITPGGATSTRGHSKGWCVFSFKDGNSQKCAIHAYCLKNDLNPFEYKPPICSLFPVEGIILPNGNTYVFCSCSDTNEFTMYFYTLTRRPCVSYQALCRVLTGEFKFNKYYRTLNYPAMRHDGVIKLYKPAYREQESVLRYFCGDRAYRDLEAGLED